MQSEGLDPAGELLNGLIEEAGMARLSSLEEVALRSYLSLFIRWNSRINLSSVRDPKEIVSRHLIESIACARVLPERISTLLDFGSGGGLPGVPIAICRPEVRVTLAESQVKKASFLREVARTLEIPIEIFGNRAETLEMQFDCVTLRAVDKMAEAVRLGAQLVTSGGWLALMTTSGDAPKLCYAAGEKFEWQSPRLLPNSEDRVLAIGKKLS